MLFIESLLLSRMKKKEYFLFPKRAIKRKSVRKRIIFLINGRRYNRLSLNSHGLNITIREGEVHNNFESGRIFLKITPERELEINTK